MPSFIAKSGKEQHQVQHTKEQTFQDFQAKIFSKTDIPPKNLKILFKTKMIKDNQSLLGVPDGSKLVIMGTKVGKQLKKTGQIKIQSMVIEQQKKIQRFGLVNIGNTCYMNASIQFLRSVPALNQMMKSIKLTDQNNSHQAIGSTLSGVLKELEKKDVTPQYFVGLFLNFHPQFQPFKSQHDADQFMQKLLEDIGYSGQINKKIIRQTFQIQLQNTLRNKEIPEQQLHITYSTTNKIGCSLGGNQKDIKVGNMLQGIKLGLQGQLQKKSMVDDTNHIYESVNRFNSLPPFLIIQMVRFFWKQVNDPDSQFNKPMATKICRSISFGKTLDVFDFCTEELKQKLKKGKQAYQKNQIQEQLKFKQQFQAYKDSLKDSHRPQKRVLEDFKQIWAAKKVPLTQGLQTGIYQMKAVVTHLGNSVQSGHYMAWVKQVGDQWTKFDDDTVYSQQQQKVLQLRGGQPNLQIAYLLMFRKVYAKPIQE